jgi:hypothetical protein
MKNEEKTTDNEHIGEIAAVAPQKRQYELGSYYPTQATLSSYAAKLRYPAPQGGRKKSHLPMAFIVACCMTNNHRIIYQWI